MNVTELCVNCKKNNSCTRCWKTSNKKCPYFTRKTNADKIRSMSDEGLAVFLDGFSSRCLDCAEDAKNQSCPIYKEGHYCRPQEIMEWLRQPVEEVNDGK